MAYRTTYVPDAGYNKVSFNPTSLLCEELNEMQDIIHQKIRDLADLTLEEGLMGVGNTRLSGNTFIVEDEIAYVNGEFIHITQLEKDVSIGDKLYLFVKEQEITPSSLVKKYGNQQETKFADNLLFNEEVGIETSYRRQIIYNLTLTNSGEGYYLHLADIVDDGSGTPSIEMVSHSGGVITEIIKDIQQDIDTIDDGMRVLGEEIDTVSQNLTNHQNNKSNPHEVTKSQVGLGNVDNVKQASKSEFDTHVSDKNNPHGVTKSQVGLGNVANVLQASKTEFDSHANASAPHSGHEKTTNKGKANGYAGLDSNAKIPLSQLPDLSKQQTHIVNNPTEREALTGLIMGDRAFELETGDSYIWDGSIWHIMADADWENVSLDWSNITNKPDSTIEQIDEAVNHVEDSERHITSTERNTWNAKETPSGAQQKANNARDEAKQYADETFLPLTGGKVGYLEIGNFRLEFNSTENSLDIVAVGP